METCFWCILLLIVGIVLLYRWIKSRLKVSDFSEANVLVTGCDSGFGREIALKLDKLGARVFAACFTEKGMDNLRKISSDRLTTFNLDIRKQKSVDAAFDFVTSKIDISKGLWGLVNNAGIFCTFGLTEWFDVNDFNELIDVNLYGPIRVTRTFLPLVRRAQGRIVNVTSGSGRFSVPFVAPYSVSKYGLESYTDTLRRELYHTGVKVSLIEPGVFSTPLIDPAQFLSQLEKQYHKVSPEVRDYYGLSIYERFKGFYDEKYAKKFSTALYKVADAMTHALSARYPKCRYVVGWDARLVYMPLSKFPEWISDFVLAKFLDVPHFPSR